jgi:hypothetical protein
MIRSYHLNHSAASFKEVNHPNRALTGLTYVYANDRLKFSVHHAILISAETVAGARDAVLFSR